MRRPILWLIALWAGGAVLAQAPSDSITPSHPQSLSHPRGGREAPPSARGGSLTAAEAPVPAPAADPVLDAMARVRFLLGRWEGEGRMRMGPGEPKPTQVTEHVYEKVGGRVIVLEGHGTTPGAEGAPPVTVHQAFGVLAWDPDAGEYLLRAFRGDGRFVDADVEVGDERLVWGFDTPNGRIRYTVTLDDAGRWHEVGEIDRGGAWTGFFEMTLSRVGDE